MRCRLANVQAKVQVVQVAVKVHVAVQRVQVAVKVHVAVQGVQVAVNVHVAKKELKVVEIGKVKYILFTIHYFGFHSLSPVLLNLIMVLSQKT